MKKFLFIPVVNRFDLAEKALNSVSDLETDPTGSVVLVRNDASGVFGTSLPFNIIQNTYRNIAIVGQFDYYMFMHNDAELVDERGIKGFCDFVESLDINRWSVVFSNYDTLCAYNTKVMNIVGVWDTFLQQYFADNDMYHRMRLAGFPTVESNFKVLHNEGASATIHADPERNFLNGITFPIYEQYYIKKWGGRPGQERYKSPFNRG